MTDFIESLTGQIKQRLSSPIFGSFIIAWVCWNYRFLVVIFSSLDVQERLKVAQAPYSDATKGFWLLIGFPLLSAIGYVLIYPLFSRPLLLYWEWQNRLLEDRLTEAQKKRRLTEDESQKLILMAREQRAEFQQTLARLEAENSALANSLKESRGRLATADPQPVSALVQSEAAAKQEALNTNRLESLTDSEKNSILGVLTSLGSYQYSSLSEHELLENISPNERIRVRAGIESAIIYELLKAEVRENGTRMLSLTPKGTRYLLNGRNQP